MKEARGLWVAFDATLWAGRRSARSRMLWRSCPLEPQRGGSWLGRLCDALRRGRWESRAMTQSQVAAEDSMMQDARGGSSSPTL